MSGGAQWWDRIWNVGEGCTAVSEGCENCSALTYGPPTFHAERLAEPFGWKTAQLVSVCAGSDLFHEAFTGQQIEAVFEVMSACPQHRFFVLTKRAERMRKLAPERPLRNVWLGVTAENQKRLDERMPLLQQAPADRHFIAVSPMLGPVLFSHMEVQGAYPLLPHHDPRSNAWLVPMDWVLCGPEDGPVRRPFRSHWAADLRRECTEEGIPYFDMRPDHAEWREPPV